MLSPALLGISWTNSAVNAYYQQSSVPITPEQYNVIQSLEFARANAIYAWILTATVTSQGTGTITTPPNVVVQTVGLIT